MRIITIKFTSLLLLLVFCVSGVYVVRVHSQNVTPTSHSCTPQNKEITVGPVGSAASCSDLQEAINAVTEEGTHIKLQKGTYTFNSFKTNAIEIINKPLMYIENAENTASRGVNILISNASVGMYIEKSAVLLSGLDITSSTYNHAIKLKNVPKAELNSLLLSNDKGNGITIDTSADVSIYKSLLKSVSSAVRLSYANNVVLANNTITSSTYGIQMNNSYGFIEHNLITANKTSAVYMSGNNSIELTSNTITHNSGSSTGAVVVHGYSTARSKLNMNKNIISKNGAFNNLTSVGVNIEFPSQVDLKITNNDVWENGTNYRGIDNPEGKDGNVSVDPKFANTTNFCLDPTSPLITNKETLIDFIGYRSTCDQGLPPLPTPVVSNTPAVTLVPTITSLPQPIPSQPDSCICKTDDMCDGSCLSVASSSGTLKCSRESAIGPTPEASVKNSFCKRYYRSSGDIDGNNKIDTLDYFYYLRVVNGGQVPTEVNADVNGDGLVSPSDRAIVVQSINNPPSSMPTSTGVPTPIAVTPTAITPTLTPNLTVTPTPTSVPGARYGCSNNCTEPISTGWFTSQSYCQVICKNLNLMKVSTPTPSN